MGEGGWFRDTAEAWALLAQERAAMVLADHIAAIGVRAPTSPFACECGVRGQACDYPAHLARALADAGLLKETN
jgi:hypothetical protein